MTATTDSAEVKSDTKPEPEKGITVDGITVDLLDDCVQVHQGKGITKFIAYEVFLELLNKIANKNGTKEKRQDYYLPSGTYYFTVSSTTMQVACYYPECKREIKYRPRGVSSSESRMTVVIPNLVIAHTLTKKDSTTWVVSDSRYLVTYKTLSQIERRFPSKSDPDMERMCFTNVYGDARLCYGENVRVAELKMPDLRGLSWYYEILFISPFNDDLGLNMLTKTAFRENYSSWYKHLEKLAQTNGSFDYKDVNKFKTLV